MCSSLQTIEGVLKNTADHRDRRDRDLHVDLEIERATNFALTIISSLYRTHHIVLQGTHWSFYFYFYQYNFNEIRTVSSNDNGSEPPHTSLETSAQLLRTLLPITEAVPVAGLPLKAAIGCMLEILKVLIVRASSNLY